MRMGVKSYDLKLLLRRITKLSLSLSFLCVCLCMENFLEHDLNVHSDKGHTLWVFRSCVFCCCHLNPCWWRIERSLLVGGRWLNPQR